ncbi:MAG: arginine--tRNA ligase [Aggregatilineales bacterium]
MKPLPNAHSQLVVDAIKAARIAGDLPEFDIPDVPINLPKNPEHGDYASPIALALAKVARKKPLEIAEIIVKHLPSAAFLEAAEVLPPGFINFRLDQQWLKDQVNTIIVEGEDLFKLELGAGKRAQVEFVSANPTGPLHIGRSRGAVIGDTIARILEATGYEVEREYYFNNAGVQMRNLGESLKLRYLQALGKDVTIPGDEDKAFYQGDYLVDYANTLVEEKSDSLVDADWTPFKEYAEKRMFENIKATLQRIDIQHNVFFNENSLYDSRAIWDVLEELQQNGHIYESTVRESESEDVKAQNAELKPAQWFRSTTFGDAEDRVLVKGDGEPTYTLPDIAYHKNKIERGFDLLVNILGADHFVQHQVVKFGVQALGLDVSKINVIIIQLVRMIRNGEEVKMSTRKGNYDTLDDLIDQTSTDAVRYILLARSANSRIDFDLDLAVKQTNDNPVYYIQYALVRCAGIMREAEARGFNDDDADLSLLGDEEMTFIRKMLELGEQLDYAATNLTPHTIAFYALDLANAFHPMYDKVRVMGDTVPDDLAKARLRYYKAAQTTFKRVLRLMGMTTPDRM